LICKRENRIRAAEVCQWGIALMPKSMNSFEGGEYLESKSAIIKKWLKE
jgi:hypothetical protein